jgi:hypothetical protein
LRRVRALLFAPLLLAACADSPAPQPESPASPHHHELHLPPVGPTVAVALDGKSIDVTMANVPHTGTDALLFDVVRAAFPAEDPQKLHLDSFGSDGFHAAARPPCATPLSAAQLAEAHIDIVTHDLHFDPKLALPGCYSVHAVVSVTATR